MYRLILDFKGHSIPGQSISEVPMGQAFIQACRFSLVLSFCQCQCSILTFIYVLRSPEWQAGETWETSEKQNSYKNRGALDKGVYLLFVSFKGENKTETSSMQSKRSQFLGCLHGLIVRHGWGFISLLSSNYGKACVREKYTKAYWN